MNMETALLNIKLEKTTVQEMGLFWQIACAYPHMLEVRILLVFTY